MHVENQSQQVSIRFNPVAPIAPGHCFYFIIFMNQIYQRALLETTSCQYLMQKNLLGAGFVREIQGSADLQRLEMTHRYGYGSKATLLNIQNIGPYWAHMLHHFFNIYHPIPTSIYICHIYIYIFALSLPSGSHPPMPGYQEQLWYRWLLPGFFMIPEGSFRRSQKRPMLKYDLNMGLSENRVYSQL